MRYTKPQLLNTKAASATIMGKKIPTGTDNNLDRETVSAYRSDE
jgi:hypothetical protein